MPIASVIIPVYNGAKTIQETIRSVLCQRFQDFELIVINDGSNDLTLEAVSSFYDLRIKVFSYPHSGASVSRNRGFSHSLGRYVSFLDSDDLWTTDKLELQIKALMDNLQAMVAYSWVDAIDENGKFLYPCTRSRESGNICSKLMLGNFTCTSSNPLIKREAFTEVGGFDPAYQQAEDWDLLLRLAGHHHFACVPSVQVMYRQTANSYSQNTPEMERACLSLLKRVYEHAGDAVSGLKKTSYANVYWYLANKAVKGRIYRYNGLLALKFLLMWLKNAPLGYVWGNKGSFNFLLKSALRILLFPSKAKVLNQG